MGAATGLAVLAACASEVRGFDSARLWLALGCALALGVAYAREESVTPRRLGEQLDRAADKRLALVTAWERGAVEREGPFDRALAAQALEGVRPGRLLHAVVPSAALAVAAPLLAGAVLVLTLAEAERRRRPPEVRELVGVAAAELDGLLAGSGAALDRAGAEPTAWTAALTDARRLSDRVQRDAAGGVPDAELLDELDRALAELQATDPSGDAARAVERARSALDAVRPRETRTTDDAVAGDGPGDSAGDTTSGGAGGPGAAPSSAAVGARGEDGVVPADRSERDGPGLDPWSGPGERGGLRLSERDAALVRAWLEAERAER